MPSKKQKYSRAKRFAEVERLSMFGTVVPMGPIGLWLFADRYRDAAVRLGAEESSFDPARYFLVCHSIELALKAYLSLRGTALIDLAGTKYGHDLESILEVAENEGLSSIVDLTADQRDEIRKATTYYAGKVFEYPALTEAVRGYSGTPDFRLLIGTSEALIAGLYKPCLKAK